MSEPIELPPEEDIAFDEELAATLNEPVVGQKNVEIAAEPLFSLLLKEAIDPQDVVLRDYAEFVAPRLSHFLGHVAAKGGQFVRDRLNEGKTAKEVERYGDDQTMRAHIVNGLLPTARIACTLKDWDVWRFRKEFDEGTYRLFCAGYTLHDWLKLPEVDAQLQAHGLQHHTVNPAVHLETVTVIIREWCVKLGLDSFLTPLGSLDDSLHDLIYIASNTQLQWGVMHNLSALPGLRYRSRGTLLATELATLADYLAYLGRTPLAAVMHPAIKRQMEAFDDRQIHAQLTYHHLADVRGVLTNIIHNAAVDAYAVPNMRVPLLYAPTGVVYLARGDAPAAPSPSDVAQAVVARIQNQGRIQLERDLTGFNRDGKGLKYADYYLLFFAPAQLACLIARFAEKRMMNKSDAQKRYDSIRAKQMASAPFDMELPAEPEVDRIAEVCALLVKLATEYAPAFDAEGWLLEQLGALHLRDEVRHINSNRTAGGVPYGWYYVAGWYRQRTFGKEPEQWNEFIRELAEGIARQLPTEVASGGGWYDIAQYVTEHLRFANGEASDLRERMAQELGRYSNARKIGRGGSRVCSLCSSPYTVQAQQEAAILFAPMVYTNKQPLHSSNAIRNICAVCGMEMMLRQLLMKRGRESGGNFEKRKLRYLFFYPTYFFTPETLRMLRAMQDRLKRVSFTTLRTLLQPDLETARYDLRPEIFQRLHDLMLHPSLIANEEDDRLFRLRFPDKEPITFSFLGLPPADRDAKDAEAWINPAFLALVLPLLLDIKVVASESMLPSVQEATELPETVAFDSAHAYVGYLTEPAHLLELRTDIRRTPGRFNIDEVVPALQRLVSAYFVHMDGNAKTGAGGYDYRWHEIGPLARNLATSPLYAFYYLKKSLRRDGADAPSGYKATLYINLVNDYLGKGDERMSHARELVTRYRRFYRHGRGRLNSNAILRPIREAADTLLEANLRLFDDDAALRELVSGRLKKSLEGMSKPGSSGVVPGWLYPGDPRERSAQLEAVIDDFAAYFVDTIYRNVFAGNRAALAGKQLNLLKNACEAIYVAEQRREWQERGENAEDKQSDEE
ncbi:MAG: type I-D CRISPR-associated protein Cas10d/Csc3 [Chloroflexi bacterium SZAS-1]|jgi:CRISPR-associated protein Csc3|nr:type I-D CRISPR-associated protein Cas10d/Csc3 [Chloroflexi bacterium SZAS-1]